MIVKNEEDFLEECLQSIKSVADEIILVDTGSTDKTLEIAKKFNAKIYNFKWINDFSAARNESIKYASGNWILWLDADERLLTESLPQLTKLLVPQQKAIGYIVQIKNVMADGKNYRLSGAHRLFNNHKGIQFSGRIHEQIAPSLSKLEGEERSCKVQLLHHGYGLNPEDQKNKNARNRRLLTQMVKEEPDNAYAHYTLAQNYSIEKEWSKAEKHFRITLKKHNFNPDMTGSLLNTYAECLMHLNQLEKAGQLALDSIQKIPEQVGAYYLLYKIHEHDSEALDWLLKLHSMNDMVDKQGKQLSTDVILNRDDVLWEILKRYDQTKEYDHVLKFMKMLSKTAWERSEVLLVAARAYLSKNEFNKSKQILLNNALKDNPQALDLLGLIYIQSASFTEAIEIYEKILKILPKEIGVIRRLAGLYAKTGQSEKAAHLIERMSRLK